MHLAARSGDAKMLECLLKHLSPEERVTLVNMPE